MEDSPPKFLSQEQEAASENTSSDSVAGRDSVLRLTELAKISTELARLVAKNPRLLLKPIYKAVNPKSKIE